MVNELCQICEENGLQKPTVYQGQYNALCRGAQEQLFAVIRRHGLKFNAYRFVFPSTSYV
jgi:aflatoxin B1 aldehyde reductase